MRERGETFGEGLLGVLTEPPEGPVNRPCLVILNAGLIHRVGPGRLSVEIARRAAAAGFPALRFDLSGFGDSPPRTPPLGAIESSVADVGDALRHLHADHGFHKFVLFGLCSGAILAHHAMVAHEEVVGAVLLDGYSFPTLRFWLGAAAERLRSPLGLVRAVGRRMTRPFRKEARARVPIADETFLPRWPSRSRVEADLQAVCARGVQLLTIYSGEWRYAYRHEGQLREAFPRVRFGSVLRERQIPAAEHLYFTRPEREHLLELLTGWLEERFPEPGR